MDNKGIKLIKEVNCDQIKKLEDVWSEVNEGRNLFDLVRIELASQNFLAEQ